MTPYNYIKVLSIKDALSEAYKNKSGEISFVSGGTDLMVNKFQGNDMSDHLIDVSGISELRKINCDDTILTIGAAVTLDEIIDNLMVQKYFPVLIETAKQIASPVIRISATIGGNLMCENRCSFYNQSEWWRSAVGYCLKCEGDVCIATGGKKACFSKFVSDMAVSLIALYASVEIVSKNGSRECAIKDLYTGNGLSSVSLKKSEIIKAIKIPLNNNIQAVFMKLRVRKSLDFGSLTTVVSIGSDKKKRIVLGCVDPGPVIVDGDNTDEIEKMIKSAAKKARVVDNDVFSRSYRKDMIAVYLNRCFKRLGIY